MPIVPKHSIAIALWQIRLFSFLMLHFICSHFLSLNNSSVRFCDAVIYRPCCNRSNEAGKEKNGCRGNPSVLPGERQPGYDSPHPSGAGDSIPECWGSDPEGFLLKGLGSWPSQTLPSHLKGFSVPGTRWTLICFSIPIRDLWVEHLLSFQ